MPDPTTAAARAADGRTLSDYGPLPGSFDEMFRGAGAPWPHCEYLVGALQALGSDEIARRRQETRRLLHENGVTYNVYSDAQPSERLWPLDPIPVLFPSGDWAAIEQGLIQRAELLDLLLADLYGPRTLIRRGVLPPELIVAHPGFLRPCDGVRLPGRHQLPLYAADLARAPDGRVWVIGDRSQAPSGAGYALENRTVMAHVLPSVYRDSHVHRLALFFRSVRVTLQQLDPRRQENPRVVVLTPGPENETYFEHAFLANYLGYTLVQGGDLEVRDDRVWLKALDGRQPVDVILRRVDGGYCDPLELRPESLLGTPGLLHVARRGHVAIANPLGSGVLENPGLMAFLPQLARELLSEELKLPSVATWWCGEAEARAYVLDHLEQLVIKPIAPHRSVATVFGATLSAAERGLLAAQIRARPHLFAAQELVPLSTAPVVLDGRTEPRPMVLRSFLVAHEEDGYVVMPGGLARVAPSPDTWVVSNQRGGVSKDVWVLASEPERQVSLLPPSDQPITLKRDGDDVPGRVADDLFWLGRYVERTEGAAQLLREVLLRLIGSERAAYEDALPALLRSVTYQTGTFPGFVEPDGASLLRTPERELLGVLLDRKRLGSLRYNIDALVRTGHAVRDRLPSDASRMINALNRELSRPSDLAAALEALQRVLMQLAALAGFCNESMSRSHAWQFLEIGRHLERAVHTVCLLRSVFVHERAALGATLEAVLAVAHSLKTYRRRYRAQLRPGAVLDLLLLDETNPRSVAYQLVQLQALVAELSAVDVPHRSVTERLMLDALTHTRLFDVASVDTGRQDAEASTPVEHLLLHLTRSLAELSDEITRRYFSHADAPQQLIRLV